MCTPCLNGTPSWLLISWCNQRTTKEWAKSRSKSDRNQESDQSKCGHHQVWTCPLERTEIKHCVIREAEEKSGRSMNKCKWVNDWLNLSIRNSTYLNATIKHGWWSWWWWWRVKWRGKRWWWCNSSWVESFGWTVAVLAESADEKKEAMQKSSFTTTRKKWLPLLIQSAFLPLRQSLFSSVVSAADVWWMRARGTSTWRRITAESVEVFVFVFNDDHHHHLTGLALFCSCLETTTPPPAAVVAKNSEDKKERTDLPSVGKASPVFPSLSLSLFLFPINWDSCDSSFGGRWRHGHFSFTSYRFTTTTANHKLSRRKVKVLNF